MTLRLTSSSFAGTSRKLVAVGTARLASMLATIAAPAPRIGSPGVGDRRRRRRGRRLGAAASRAAAGDAAVGQRRAGAAGAASGARRRR